MTKRNPQKERKCIWCDVKFMTSKSQVVCCSDECRQSLRLKMNSDRRRLNRIVTCVVCGSEFQRPKGRAITCSKECSLERRKETARSANKTYRKRNPEKDRQYYIKNKEKCNARSKNYYEDNKSSILEWQKSYNEKKSDKVRGYKARWYLKNKSTNAGEYSSFWIKAEETRSISKSTGADTDTVSRVKDWLKSSLGIDPPPDLVYAATQLRLFKRELRNQSTTST